MKITYIELLSVLLGLQELSVVEVMTTLNLGLKPGLDRLVLLVEVGQIGHEILHHEHVRQRVDLSGLRGLVDVAQTSQGVFTIDVHGATATDTLTAGSAQSQSRILLVLNLKKNIKHHRSAIVEVDRVSGHVRLLPHLFRVPSVNFEVPVENASKMIRKKLTIY